jgi:hypothetical protein
MPFQYTFRAADIPTWESAARDVVENRDRELELYSTTIDTSFLNLNASNLTSGTVPSARMTGAYTGITGLGTLTSLTVTPSNLSSFTLGNTTFTSYSGIAGDKGYLLVGNSVGDTSIYLRSSGAGVVYLGASNSNTLLVGNGTVTVAGTMNATTFSGSEVIATTVLGGTNRGVGIKADPTNAQSILQFTNNAMTAQWSSIVATNGLLTATTSVAVSGNVTVPNTTLNYFGSANGSNVFYPMDTSNNMFLKVGTGNFYVNAPNHYFRNASSAIIMSLASSGAVTINGELTVNAAVYASNWFRSTGTTGWYSQTYGGGIYMDDVNEVKVYGGKAFYVPSSITSGNQISCASNLNVGGTIVLYAPGISYQGSSVGGGSANQIGFRWASPYVNCTVDNVISAAAAYFSDRRLKTNIQTLTNGIDLVRGLRCVKYNPLDVIGFDEETFEPIIGDLDPYDEMIGFIADEVQEVYANAIHGEGNRMKSIDTVQLLSIAVSAIQDLDQRLQQLETV